MISRNATGERRSAWPVTRGRAHELKISVNRLLDRLVHMAHRRRGLPLHPYLVLFYLGVMAGLLLVLYLSFRFEDLELAVLLLIVLYLAYEAVFLPLKRRILRIDSRSYLQDLVVFLLPVALGLAWLTGTSLRGFLDLMALFFPLVVGFVRIGCFLGGCCYGTPGPLGVRYPDHVFVPFDGGACRTFRPGANPRRRVFPIQLVESAINFALVGALLAVLVSLPEPRGLLLPLYLLAYSVFRTAADCFRTSSARPRYGPFSEAQCVAAVIIVACGAWLAAAAS